MVTAFISEAYRVFRYDIYEASSRVHQIKNFDTVENIKYMPDFY